MNQLQVRLRQLNQNLSRLRVYSLVRTSRLFTILVLFGVAWLIFCNVDGFSTANQSLEKWSSYGSAIVSQSPLNKTRSHTTSSDGSDALDKELYNYQSSKEDQNRDASEKFIFINNKYPNPSGYQNILDQLAPEEFQKKSLVEKCSLYFTNLYEKDPNWALKALEAGYPYNGYIFDTKDRYIEDRKNEFKNTLRNKDIISDEDLEAEIEKYGKKYQWDSQYEQSRKESYDSEKYMTDQMTNLRVFSQCYLGDIDPVAQDMIDHISSDITCEENEKRLFSFLTREFPTYVRWNGTSVSNKLPIIDDFLKNEAQSVPNVSDPPSSGCFIRDLKNSYNGKGIVISAADMHIDELSSLLLVLRALKNKLPIQITHRGDLSLESQANLTMIARSEDLNLDSVSAFKKIVQKFYEHVHDLSIESIFPKQEIWYVNIAKSVDPEDKRFLTYGNKLLALLFSSFEDTVLIDTDTVPFVDIDLFILQSQTYKDLGAFFFKDRQLYDRMTGPELTYFRKLLPTRLDTAFFDIPELTNHTYNNRFFGDGFKHIQESGMVSINKKRHFRSVLTINVLQMWHAATTRVHGDKELFWLGFSIAGDEDYYLNKYGVGAVGTINPKSNRLIGDEDDSRRSKLKSTMVCTTHPAHLSGLDDHTLLWMNSGFVTCKRPDEAAKDIKMDLYKNVFKDEDELRQTYVGPLKIEAIVVPPPQEKVINNDLGEPSSGWDVMFGCGGYLYCAYDSVGASEDPEFQGTLVEYDDDQVLWYDYLGELWVDFAKIVKTPEGA